MEAAAASGLSDAAVKLFNLLDGSYQKFKHLPEDVLFIKRELRSIQEAIIKSSGDAGQDGIRSWIADLKEIRNAIEDAVDFYGYKVICKRDRRFWLSGAFHDAKILPDASRLIDDIKHIKKLVAEAKQRVDSYHQQQLPQTGRGNQIAYHHANEANPLGLEIPKAELLHKLSDGGFKPTELRVIAISGLGGSGKTTLAKAGYDEALHNFNCKAWVRASGDVDKDKLLDDIFHQMEVPIPPPYKDPSQHLGEFLKTKRYLVGIDDLQSGVLWNSIRCAFPNNNMSSRIIVTTTNDRIARSCHNNCGVQRMQPLDNGSARALLERKVFADNRCSTNLGQGLEMILEICEYHPLAIVNMADHMRSTGGWVDHDMCVHACKNIGSLLVNTNNDHAFVGMNQVLNRSYNCLNYHTMICLMSLSTYPKDHVIKRKSLIRRWLAERLITCEDCRQEEDLLNECFTALVDHHFILPTDVSICGQVKAFRVHRIVLHFIKAKAKSENFVTWIGTDEGMKVEAIDIRRLYLDNSSSKPPRIKVDLSRVRSLTFSGQASKTLMNFRDYKLLRVLDLENCKNLKDEDLESVCRSPMLKYLSIRGNKDVSSLPSNIVKLRRLETLDIRDTKVEMLLIDHVIQLPELAHLFGEFQVLTGKKCNSSKLQTLSGFFIDEMVTSLLSMPMLNKVRILCRQTPSEKVIQDLLLALKSCFEKNVNDLNQPLQYLSIDFRGCNLNFLDNLTIEPPYFLRSLKLCGKLTKLPDFIKSLSESLRELCLSGTNLEGSVLLDLQCLKSLQFLKLTEDPFNFEAELAFQNGWFHNLKRICFVVPKVPKIVIQDNALKGLESLQLFCKEIGGVSGILYLDQLNEVILPSHVSGAEADDLLQQVSKHSKKPKLLDADGSSRPMWFSRRLAFNKRLEGMRGAKADEPDQPM